MGCNDTSHSDSAIHNAGMIGSHLLENNSTLLTDHVPLTPLPWPSITKDIVVVGNSPSTLFCDISGWYLQHYLKLAVKCCWMQWVCDGLALMTMHQKKIQLIMVTVTSMRSLFQLVCPSLVSRHELLLIQFTCKSFKLSNIIYGHPIIYSDHCGWDKGHFASSMMWHLSHIYVLHWSICWECNEDGRVQRQARMLCKMWHLQTCFLECTQFSQDRLHTMELWEILKPLSTLLCWFRNGLTSHNYHKMAAIVAVIYEWSNTVNIQWKIYSVIGLQWEFRTAWWVSALEAISVIHACDCKCKCLSIGKC
jgi:hypothetical protein